MNTINCVAYTYTIKFLLTGQIYYGVRYAKGCHPEELGIKYFSSSKTVKKLILEHGVNNFKFSIRKIFNNAQKARSHETKVLRRLKVKSNNNFLNLHDNSFFKCRDHSGEKNPMCGKPAPNRGKKHKPETIQKMIIAKQINPTWVGQHLTDDHKHKIAIAQTGKLHRKFKGYYHTPFGVFESSRLVNHPLISHKAIQRWCANPDVRISLQAIAKSKFLKAEDVNKTFRDLGFWFEQV